MNKAPYIILAAAALVYGYDCYDKLSRYYPLDKTMMAVVLIGFAVAVAVVSKITKKDTPNQI